MPEPIAERIPELRPGSPLPVVFGTGALTTMAFAGRPMADIAAMIETRESPLARAYDLAILYQLGLRKLEALALQSALLAQQPLFRIASSYSKSLRLLAIMAPGDLMVNAPLDFLTAHLDIQLDLLYLLPDTPLPAIIPDHDLAFFAVSEADPALQRRLSALYRSWPRPVLNDPAHLPLFARDTLAAALAALAPLHSAPTRRLPRGALLPTLQSDPTFPLLIRPIGSHAGADLTRLATPEDAAAYLQTTDAPEFYLTRFVDYRSADGLYRKYRIAFIDDAPYLCHMAASENWMVHYLNAGMTESAEKRALEAHSMATFDDAFARRHAAAFDALNAIVRLDYYSIDCAETPDGKLLVFEADTGAIIHMMDPPDLFPYKRPQMQRTFAAFATMLRRRCVTAQTARAGAR